MRIHTDKVSDVRTAIYGATATLPGVYADVTEHGSRSRAGALELRVTAEPRPGRRLASTMGPNSPGNRGEYAATWDEWGAVFAAIFTADPNATCYAYDGADHFHWATGNRYDGRPINRHDQHRWELAGEVVTGAYAVHACKGRRGEPCPAIRRVARR